jgi:hypothetical protein
LIEDGAEDVQDTYVYENSDGTTTTYVRDSDGNWYDEDGNQIPESDVPAGVVEAAKADDQADADANDGTEDDDGGEAGVGTSVAPDGEHLAGPDDGTRDGDRGDLVSPENIDPDPMGVGGRSAPDKPDVVTLIGQPPVEGGTTPPVGDGDDVVAVDGTVTDPEGVDGDSDPTGLSDDDDPFADDTVHIDGVSDDPADSVDDEPPSDQPTQPGMYTQAPIDFGKRSVEAVGVMAATPDDLTGGVVEPVTVEAMAAATADDPGSKMAQSATASGNTVDFDDPLGDGSSSGDTVIMPDEDPLAEPAEEPVDDAHRLLDVSKDLRDVDLTVDLEPDLEDFAGP